MNLRLIIPAGFGLWGAILVRADEPLPVLQIGTDFSWTLDQAAVDGKMVLLDFTGADWCRWCIHRQLKTSCR